MKFLLLVALLPACFGAFAQAAYPTKPITIIVPFGPGGVADITARSFGQAISAALGQPVIIDSAAYGLLSRSRSRSLTKCGAA